VARRTMSFLPTLSNILAPTCRSRWCQPSVDFICVNTRKAESERSACRESSRAPSFITFTQLLPRFPR
jgi:hypothetical protein